MKPDFTQTVYLFTSTREEIRFALIGEHQITKILPDNIITQLGLRFSESLSLKDLTQYNLDPMEVAERIRKEGCYFVPTSNGKTG